MDMLNADSLAKRRYLMRRLVPCLPPSHFFGLYYNVLERRMMEI